jgi:DNA-binding response OmpR family regulator
MKILVVEDEHRIANTIKEGLEQERYAVDVVYDGETGYDLASTEDYDVIVLDLMLPKMDGLEICQKLRQEDIHTPILMLTAKGQIQDKIKGFNSGADDYLTKPFSFEELLARLRALSRRPKKVLTDVLKVKDLTINLNNFKVIRDGKDIKLTSKEFSLLEYLMRNSGRVLKKEQIISHIWNYESDVLPNTVEVYIKTLRKKIDRPFSDQKSLIHTIRGFGYKLE